MQSRRIEIDILRAIGLLLIVLAHVNGPSLLHELRSFDVPLMVLCSGLAFSCSKEGHKKESYFHYLFRRSKRLVIPVWIFLTVYFVFYYALRFIITKHADIPWLSIGKSYLFLNNGAITYVWIIRVFLLVMIVSPMLNWLSIWAKRGFFLYYVFALLLIELLGRIHFQSGVIQFIHSEYVLYILGYSLLFALGLRLGNSFIANITKQRPNYLLLWGLFFFACSFGIVLFYGISEPHLSRILKYPPQIGFIIYGITGSMFSLCLVLFMWQKIKGIEESKISRVISWIGQNSIWIYLWHIPIKDGINHFFDNWLLRYILIVSISIAIYYVQFQFVKKMNNAFLNKYLRG